MYRRMESLRERGFLVSMDDFGTGYSTMNMLKNQTLDEIKIDREFIRDLEKDKSQIIIRNTIAMLQQLGAHIVIEGVETEGLFILPADAGGGVRQTALAAGTGAGYGKIDKDKIDKCADRILTGFLKLT